MRSTGDIAIQMPNDMLYFEGRKDNIIKFKGQKLSLLRINTLLEDVGGISNYVLHFDNVSSKLLLFIIQDSKTTFNEKLRYNVLKKLQSSISNLPVIEIITTIHIPLTKHGKKDVKKLLSLKNTKDQLGKNCVPMSVSESLEIVYKLWKDYTKQYSIAETDNFILSGGDSILALQLISDIEWEFQMEIPELLDIVLNCSFKDVCEIIKSNLREAQKLKRKEENISVSIKEFSPGPSPKKVCIAVSECFEIASKRGYFLRCNHSKERTCNSKICDKFNTNLSLELKCKFDLKKCIDASPCVAYFFRSNKLLAFIGSHAGLFCCFSLLETDVKWTINLPDRIESSSCISFCGKYVYVGCYDYNLYGINIKDGSIQWHFKTGAEVKSSPVVSSQNVVFVGSHDKHLYAINGENGKLLWRKIVAHGSIFSSPTLFEKLDAVSVATLDGTVAILKMDSGDFIWTFHYKKPIFSSPLFTSSGIFIGATNNCFLHFNISGSLIFEYETKGSIFSSACVILNNDHIVFGCHDSSVHCIKSNGENVWKFCGDSPIYSTPFAFQWKQSKYIAVASVSGVLYILDQTHGEVKHSWKCPGEIFSSPTVLNNFLVIGCRDNNVYCFSLSNVS
ncbi:beta-alanine-activating enzyme [Trichonephila clavipes]|nr:beta-alanine-activating enzyme [Trichonephila clavipes]